MGKGLKRNCREIEEEIMQKHGYLFCQACGRNDCGALSFHHIVYRSEKPVHCFLHNKRNLILVGQRCHAEFHQEKRRRNYLIEERKLTELFGDDILLPET